MSMLEWAKREIEIATKRERGDKPENEWDYGCACYSSALKAFESLCGDGHSGMSIGFTKNILNRLIDGKPLTPIEDTEDVWINNMIEVREDYTCYQCNRVSSLFKYVYKDGRVEYKDINACYCEDINTGITYHNGLVSRLHRELYPITMPYMPPTKADKVVCGELLTDPKNGDFDTVAVFYIVKPDGQRVNINRYFKEADTETGWEEIYIREYKDREKMDKDRKERVAKSRLTKQLAQEVD